MRGCYCDGSSILLRTDLPEPNLAAGEALIRVRAAGICDTDIQLARGYMNFRGVLGHEFVGQTEDGRRVTAEINCSCHDCPTCRAGLAGHCPHRTVVGIFGRDGAMADLVAVPERNLHEIPEEIDDAEAVFIEPLAAAFRVAEQVDLGPDARVAIVGDGKLGLLCAWVVRASGARVALVGKHPEKLELAGEGIVTHLLDEIADVRAAFDTVVDATGSPTGLATAFNLVRPRGTVVLKTTVAGEHPTNLAPIVINEICVLGSRCGPFPRAIKALEDREIDVRPLIGAVYDLDDVEDAFRAASARGARKVLLTI